MKHLAAVLVSAFLASAAHGDALVGADGHWRGTGTGHDFDGVIRDIRCRLDVSTAETGRIDLRGSCAGPDGSQSFRLFVRSSSEPRRVEGGRLTASGDEVSPFFSGTSDETAFSLQGSHGQSAISIEVQRHGEMLRMISTRVRGGRAERSDVLYRRS